MQKYNSKADTQKHIEKVQDNITLINNELIYRSAHHDKSKMQTPEVEIFDEVTPKLNGLTYGSDEYNAQLAQMGEALKHHYESNSHHPEHYQNGINDMTLVDLIEMFCDWCAATERHADGDIFKSIEHNRNRFGMGGTLANILINTATEYNMGRRQPAGG